MFRKVEEIVREELMRLLANNYSVKKILKGYVEEVESKLRPGLVICDVCGCVVSPAHQVSGEPEVRSRFLQYIYNPQESTLTQELTLIQLQNPDVYIKKRGDIDAYYERYIHYPTYCKAHAPKEKKRGRPKK